MAVKYTYDEFQKALADSGLYNEFSDADLKLAQQNPEAGMSILKYKQDVHSATTPEAKALANMGAESIRSSYGGYTGGKTGSQYYLDPQSPKDYQSSAAPTYDNTYKDTVSDLLDKQLSYGSFSYDTAKPEYTSRYDSTVNDLLNQVVNRQDFSYDASTDPLYSQYRKQYAREGQRATQDALGAAAAATGGIPSSYAIGAATQAGDYYASQMTDKIPELYQIALNKYMNEHSMKLADLSAASAAEQADYTKYLNELSQYNTDRNFAYGTYQDEYNRLNNDLQTVSGLEQNEYNKYLNTLNQYNTDRNFEYSQLIDEINNQTAKRQEALTKALTAAELGDYSLLNNMGINTDNNSTDYERKLQLAQLAAQYGDYSGLKALGIDTSAYEAALAAQGSSSGGGGSSSSGSSKYTSDKDYKVNNDGSVSVKQVRKLSFDPDEGIFRWGGSGDNYSGAKEYKTLEELTDAWEAAAAKGDLTEDDLNVLKRKLYSQMGSN